MFAYYELFGFIAGTFTTMAFVPQIVKVIKTKSTGDFSFGWLLMTFTGLVLWLLYGLIIKSQPVIIFNFLSIILVSIIIFYKLNQKSIAFEH